MRTLRPHAALAALAAIALSLACAKDERPIRVEQYRLPAGGQTYEVLEYVDDPIEPVNRKSFSFTKAVIDYGVRPAAIGWRAITHRRMRDGIDNFAYNLEFPRRLTSLLLQARLVRAGQETAHFAVNTTAGVGGIVDVSERLGIPTYDEDFGQAFGKWGVGPGFYFVIPSVGPSSGRDAVGKVFDLALSPRVWVQTYGIAWGALAINSFSSRIDSYDRLAEGGYDLYLPARALWAIQRDIEVTDYEIPESAYANADPAPSLGILLTRLDDPNFEPDESPQEAHIDATGKDLPYLLWLQPQPAPLVFIVPGIGSHRSATNAVKLAESAFERGYSAVTVSNPFNAEFIESALSETYPGYTPSDAADLYRVFSEIRADIEEEHPGQVTSSSLMGYSLGAIEALFVSQIERRAQEPGALHFERIVAINPPVNLEHAVRRFDEYFDIPRSWPQAERRDRSIEAARKVYVIYQGTADEAIEQHGKLPFQRDESKFLIGLSSRAITLQAIAAAKQRGGRELEVLPGQAGGFYGPFASEVSSNTLKRYTEELAIPYFVERTGEPAAELVAKANLQSQEAGLRSDPRIAVFTNRDDFLLRPSDLHWLHRVFGERVTVFPGGGHLGNLYLEPVQMAFMDALGAGAPETAAAE